MIEETNNSKRWCYTICTVTKGFLWCTGVFSIGSKTTGSLISMMKIIACLISLCHHLMTKNKSMKKGGNNDTKADLHPLPPKSSKIYQYNLILYLYYKTIYDSTFTNESMRREDQIPPNKVKPTPHWWLHKERCELKELHLTRV